LTKLHLESEESLAGCLEKVIFIGDHGFCDCLDCLFEVYQTEKNAYLVNGGKIKSSTGDYCAFCLF